MKSTGIVRKVDALGRFVIPVELCRTMGISDKTPLEVYVEDDKIILRKYQPGCVICGTSDNLVAFGGVHVCRKCAKELSEEAKRHEDKKGSVKYGT